MVDISRDARWGRVVEGAGEDPFLGSAIAAAKVKGYQGDNFAAPDKMAATIKHFGAYGAPVAGREYNTVDMSTQQLFNDYLPPYKAAVDAGAATVMASFNSLNGVPNTANPYMLTTDPAQRVGLQGHHAQRLPGGPGARGIRLRVQRRRRGAARADRRAGHRDGRSGRHPGQSEPVLDLRGQRSGAAWPRDHDDAAEQRRPACADAQVPGWDVQQPTHRPVARGDLGADTSPTSAPPRSRPTSRWCCSRTTTMHCR